MTDLIDPCLLSKLIGLNSQAAQDIAHDLNLFRSQQLKPLRLNGSTKLNMRYIINFLFPHTSHAQNIEVIPTDQLSALYSQGPKIIVPKLSLTGEHHRLIHDILSSRIPNPVSGTHKTITDHWNNLGIQKVLDSAGVDGWTNLNPNLYLDDKHTRPLATLLKPMLAASIKLWIAACRDNLDHRPFRFAFLMLAEGCIPLSIYSPPTGSTNPPSCQILAKKL